MNCSQCGHETPDGANACPNCGASLATAAPPGASAAPPGAGAAMPIGATPAAAGSGMQGFAFDIHRLSRQERIAGIASFIVLVSLFLPWVTATGSTTIPGAVNTSYSASADGFSLHGYFWIAFILCLAVIAFLVMKAGLATMPFSLPLTDDQALLVGTGVIFVIVLLGFLFKGYSAQSGSGFGYHFSVGWGFGAYLGLIAAVVAAAPLAWPAIQKRMNNS
jgi:hypothetical protein